MLTIEQKIAQKENELARLKQQKNKLANGQKIIIGGAVLAKSKKEPKIAKWLLQVISEDVKRETDIKRLTPIVDELIKVANTEQTNNSNYTRC